MLNGGQDRLARRYLWDERLPLSAVEPRLRGVRRLWYVLSAGENPVRTAELDRLRRLGLRGDVIPRSSAEQTILFTRTRTRTLAETGDRLFRRPD